MQIDSILTVKGSRVITTEPDRTIAYTIAMLRREGIGAAVVTDDERNVVGIISERDIIRAMAEHGAEILGMRVAGLMTKTVVTCTRAHTVDHVMREMTHRRIRHLPVVEDDALIGMISIGDVVKNRLEELEAETGVLREFITGRRL